MIMSIGLVGKEVSIKELLSLWTICYLGKFLGSVLLGFIFYQSDLTAGSTGTYFLKAASMKMATPGIQLIMRGILWNILVCSCVWTF